MNYMKNRDDIIRHELENEAKNIVFTWYYNKDEAITIDSLFIVWFAFLKNGYKCMLSSRKKPDDFFEVTVNKRTGEQFFNCFKRVGYQVKP